MSEEETFCIYCQKEYSTPKKLRIHIDKKHPGTYADDNVNKEFK